MSRENYSKVDDLHMLRIISTHQDSQVRLWSGRGEFLAEQVAATSQAGAAVTCLDVDNVGGIAVSGNALQL